jgi:hypothetical protein
VVVPAIAFYWHLGDLRRTSGPDEDFIAEKIHEGKPADLAEYETDEWEDFIQNQIQPWGDTPYYLGIGNHEVHPPKKRAAFIEKFHAYLDRPNVREQRLKDNSKDEELSLDARWHRFHISRQCHGGPV